MDLLRRDDRRQWGWMALAVTALCLRIAAVLILVPPEGRPSTYEHGAIAENLLAGRGFSVTYLGTEGPTSQQAPWVPAVLAVFYWAFGSGSRDAIVAYQLLQCIVGTATVVAAVRLSWALFPATRGIGWAVGWAAAIYPPHIYMATHVQAAPWGALAVTLLFALVAEAAQKISRSRLLTIGCVGGWLLLIDPILGLVLPPALLALAIALYRRQRTTNHEPRARTALQVGLRVAGVGACMLAITTPWIARNFHIHGEFVFIKSSFGYALWQGNNPLSHGTDKIPKPSVATLAAEHDGSLRSRNQALWEARHETLYIDDVLLKPTGYQEFAGLTEPERSRLLGSRAGDWIRAHPADYARLCFQRLSYFLLIDRTNPKATNGIYQASSIIWFTLSAMGLLAARRRWSTLWPLVAAFLSVTLFHTLTITSARFRIPVEPLSLVWAVAGFEPAATHLGTRIARAWREAHVEEPTSSQEPRAKLKGPHSRRAKVAGRVPARRR
ncbi:MAG: hypothetical protein K8U03_08100 [Planctomycetia bacterium]|nr:hypothetical protein [Planctomycetia bacterium]